MFDQTFVNTQTYARKPLSVIISLAAQTVLVGLILIVPILHPEILHPKIEIPLFVHLQTLHEVPPVQATHSAAPSHSIAPRVFIMPKEIPVGVKHIVDTDIAPASDSLAFVGPQSGTGQGTDILSRLGQIGIPTVAPPYLAPVAQAKPTPPAGPMRVSEGVQAAKLIYGPKPLYPQLAKTARIQGTVRIQAIIAADGSIGNLKVMSGPPLLIKAAIDAVSQWRYQATLLSGKAVEVITEIDVNFTLSQ